MKVAMRIFAVVFGALLIVGAAFGQSWPTKPVKLVVPFTAGSATDILARAFGQKLSEMWGQPVVIENHPGAGGTIGAGIVAKAAPDGYTVLIDNITGHAINASLYKKVPFDSIRDFEPVTLLASVTNLLVVPQTTGWKSVKDVIAAAKAKPGQLNYASFGTGSTAHLAGEIFKNAAGIDIIHVPYKGGAPALLDVMGGRASMMFATLPSALSSVKGGRLTAIATTGAKRSPSTPDIPTVAESGLPGFEATTWYGTMLPVKTPAAIVKVLRDDLVKITSDNAMREQLLQLGFEVQTSTPAELARHLKEETARWGKVVKQSGAQID